VLLCFCFLVGFSLTEDERRELLTHVHLPCSVSPLLQTEPANPRFFLYRRPSVPSPLSTKDISERHREKFRKFRVFSYRVSPQKDAAAPSILAVVPRRRSPY
jgi:hypothetical protein